MAISLVGRKTFAFEGTTSNQSISLTDLTGGTDTAPSAGDVVVVYYGVGGSSNNQTMTVNSGFTQLAQIVANDTCDAYLRVAYKVMGGTPDTSVEVSQTTSANWPGAGVILVFRGVDTTTPLDVAHTTASALNTALADPPSVTPSTSGAWVVSGGIGAHNNGLHTFSSSDLTGFLSVGFDDSVDVTVGVGYHQWTSGAFNPAAFTFSGTDSTINSWAALTLALRPAAAGVDAISGSTSLTFTNSGALKGTGALSGALTTAFTTAGILKGAGALSGSTSLTFSTSATGQLVASASGSTSLTFSPSGTLTGAGALSGSLSLAFTPSGTLTGAGALAGSSSVTFTPTGALVGSGALSGSTTLAFTTSGDLEGTQASGASSSFSFTTSGTLTGSGALSGSASFAFTASASLGGSAALAGSTSLTFDASGVLTGEAVEPEPQPEPEQPSGGAGQPVGGSSHSPYRRAIAEANRPSDPEEPKRRKRKQSAPTEPSAGLLASAAEDIGPEAIAAEIARVEALGQQIDELAARMNLARQILQDEEDAILALLLAA
jgi:hypothetical protein